MYSVDQIAERLGMHRKTVQRFIRSGVLKGRKIGREWRVSPEDLEAFSGQRETSSGTREAGAAGGQSSVTVSAVIELSDETDEQVSRLSNTLVAVLNTKDPGWGPARYDLLYHPDVRKARFLLYGSPRFIRTMLELVETLLPEDATGPGPETR